MADHPTDIKSIAQSDQNLRCPPYEGLSLYLPIKRTAKTPIRLGECPGWSDALTDVLPQSGGWGGGITSGN